MKFVIKGFALSALALLSACGGSDSSESTEVTPPVESFRVQDNPVDSSILALSTIESFLQVGSLANDIVKSANFADHGIEKSCSNGGVITKTYNDVDDNNLLSNMDVINVEYRECYVSVLDSTLNGEIELKLTSSNAELTDTSGEINLSNVIFDDNREIKFKGTIRFLQKKQPMSKVVSVQNIGSISLTTNEYSEQTVNFKDISFSKVEDFSNATYSVLGLGKIDIPDLKINYSFKITDPLSGHFGEYPNQGTVEAFTTEKDKVEISSNFVNYSESFNIDAGKYRYARNWSDAIEGSLWSYSDAPSNNIKPYRSDNFELVAKLDEEILDNFPASGGALKFLMSRPVKADTYETVYLKSQQWPYASIPAEIMVSGAIVSLTPQLTLNPGQTYNFDTFQVMSEQDATSWIYSTQIIVDDSLVVNYDIGTGIYREEDFPVLDASETIMNKGLKLNFKWIDINNIGINFSNENSATTSFNVPKNHKKDVTVRLSVNNGQDYEISTDISITYQPSTLNIMHFVSPSGDYIGAGQILTMDDSNALFTISRNEWENEDHLGVRVDGDTWWTLDMAAPQGEKLSTKKYENATRYPFQAPLAPGLSFTGDHRGCNISSGEFEILELTYDANNQVEKLAVNFQQSCETVNPILKGLIRYNSSAKLN
ncbi:hypothetical protein [Shewanella sp. KCT]|uniref:hypothetical protein n=1 Tax=Shewanella sp. KCT TaxID=2569535 RepID=UPI001182F4CC|nr:hypothetical protein [Shewanella sp. KCT]TVP09707.1 hypothetical protein AYI87_19610 [Shewanella sp. KCT]